MRGAHRDTRKLVLLEPKRPFVLAPPPALRRPLAIAVGLLVAVLWMRGCA